MPVFKEYKGDLPLLENKSGGTNKVPAKSNITEYPGAKGGKIWSSANDPIQLGPKGVRVVRGKHMPELLYDLLHKATPHHHEKLLYPLFDKILGDLANSNPGRYKYQMDNTLKDEKLGNLWFYVGKPGEDHETMFSCHIDTQHRYYGDCHPVLINKTNEQKEFGMVYGTQYIREKEGADSILRATPLGADDKLGAYIMLELIKKDTPGLYIFHIGEECGGVGSKWAASNCAEEFKNIKRAIAFDRANYGDIILKQFPGRCGSVEFGRQLMMMINQHLPPYQKFFNDVQGSFTDTASYQHLIPECINMSVGYWDQHSSDEHFDLIWFRDILVPALMKMEWEKLEPKRKPGDVDRPDYTKHWKSQKRHNPDDYGWNGLDDYGGPPRVYDVETKRYLKWFQQVDENAFAPSVIHKGTYICKVPKWDPKDGILMGTSLEGMERIIEAWCIRNSALDTYAIAAMGNVPKLIMDLLVENEALREGSNDPSMLSQYLKTLSALKELIDCYETHMFKQGEQHPLGDKYWTGIQNVFSQLAKELKDKTEIELDQLMTAEQAFRIFYGKLLGLRSKPNIMKKTLKRVADIVK